MILSFLLAFILVASDFVLKFLVSTNMRLGESFELIPGVLRLTYIHNTGAAFGSFSDSRWVFMILSTAMIVLLIWFLGFKKGYAGMVYAAFALMLGGGVGNMIDRLALGYVIDYVDFYLFPFWKWIFNAADAYICIGVALLCVYLLFLDKNAEKKGKKALLSDPKTEKTEKTDTPEVYHDK